MGAVTRVVLLGCALGCAPELLDDASRVRAVRVLAARAEPAEAAPGEAVTLRALVVAPDGTVSEPSLRWSVCTARRALATPGPVNPACLLESDPALATAGDGATAMATVPADACRLFGPEPPDDRQGAGGRPVDPDVTGGFFLPVQMRLAGAASAIFQARLGCRQGGLSQAEAAELTRRARPNENPAVAGLRAIVGGRTIDVAEGAEVAVARGAAARFAAAWAPCAASARCGDGVCGEGETRATCVEDCTAPRGCAGAEGYARFDLATRTVVTAREVLRVSWFSTDGSFATPRTGSDGGADESSNEWTAPATAGTVRAWVVLRDDRGGAAWRGFSVRVE